MTKWFLVLVFVVACGSKSSPSKPTPPATTPPATAPTADAPTSYKTVAELAKATDEGKLVEVTAQYQSSTLQNVAGVVHYDVFLVDGKDSLATSIKCRTKDKVTVAPFAGVTARGTLHGGALDDCTITPR